MLARQYVSATRDVKWLQSEKGAELITKLGEFWNSRVSYSSAKKQYEILGSFKKIQNQKNPNLQNLFRTQESYHPMKTHNRT